MSTLQVPTSVVLVNLASDGDSDREDTPSKPPSTHPVESTQSPLPRKSIQLLLKNNGFWSRLLVLSIIMFLWMLCSIYVLAQILNLKLGNYMCPLRGLEEVYQHSKEEGLAEGVEGQCWRARFFEVYHYGLYTVYTA